MFGEGVSPSDVWGEVPNRYTIKRIMMEQQSQMLKMQNEIAELHSKLLTQQSSQNMTHVSHNLFRPTSSNQNLPVQFFY